MIFAGRMLQDNEARLISPRLLAHLGDAVFHLFEREREILSAASVADLHRKTVRRACAANQALLLDIIVGRLKESEAEIVRRARNIKSPGQRKAGQDAYRKSTAFEALIGYLYLTDRSRLAEILNWTTGQEAD